MKKRCPRCEEWLELSDFYKNRAKLDGRSDQCKECTKKINKNSQGKNLERKRLQWSAKAAAKNRLTRAHPEMYRDLYVEEMRKRGLEPTWTSIDKLIVD